VKPRQKTHRKYFIQEYLQTAAVYHGGVGNKDIQKVLIKNQFQPILQPCHFDFSIKAKIFRVASVIKTIRSLPVNAIVVFQWPLYAILNKVFVRLILKFRKDVKLICILTDVNGLKDGNENTLSSELRFFKKIKFFVVHNDSMKIWLRQFNATAKISTLYFFDFLVDPPNRQCHKSDSIAFAGLLDKSKFIEDLHRLDDLEFHLYGPTSITVKTANDVHYHGVLSNEQLLRNLSGSFGLVWDGDSIEGLGGVFGKYNEYISPHKLSLYTVAGVPSIAHDLSGAASIIHKYGIGFTVSSLFEVKEKISQLTEDDYQKMRKNCAELANHITSGNCLIEALSDLDISRMHLND
jgi:glycosyltransferase involved in cell wall biosynthesis